MLAALGLPRAFGTVHPDPAPAMQESQASARKLTELRASPGRFLGEEVHFTLQFRALVEDWNPYLSRFESGRWLELEVWPDELFTWDEPVFAAPAARLFLRRGGGFEPLARRARTYQRFEARARVREVFLGEPWIEVLELVPLEGEVGEGTILHVTRARELAGEGQFALALDQYERARAAPLPPHALAAVLAEIRATEEARARSKTKETKDTKEQEPVKRE
jgi:hypothetical protein